MKTVLLSILLFCASFSYAQVSSISLQASGLTCSMCSKAVKEALEAVSFVEKVQVDIKNQRYNVKVKASEHADFDLLAKAVEDAGFSVASMQATLQVNTLKIEKDKHVKIGAHHFHFLNAKDQPLNGLVVFNLVDRSFLSKKDFKVYEGMTKMNCINTGMMEACCPVEDSHKGRRIFHVIL